MMKEVAGIIRLPFLLLTPICVFLAAGLAYSISGKLDWALLSLVFIGALAAHIAVNSLNEYQDFVSGLDMKTERTPFSGGSGTLPEKPQLAPLALKISIASIALTVMVGLLLVYLQGPGILIPGIPGLVIIVLYTRVINRYPLLCLLSPGLGFGILMVGGSYYALTGAYNWEVLLVSLIPFFLVNNLLLLNQFPDLHADRDAGRRHILTQYGYQFSSRVYLLFLALAALVLIASVVLDVVSAYSLLGLIVIAMGVPVYRASAREHPNFTSLVPYMGANVGIVLLLPTIVGTTLFCC